MDITNRLEDFKFQMDNMIGVMEEMNDQLDTIADCWDGIETAENNESVLIAEILDDRIKYYREQRKARARALYEKGEAS